MNHACTHSAMCMQIKLTAESFCGFSLQSAYAKLFLMMDVLVWDEVPMNHRHALECVDRTLKDVMLHLQDKTATNYDSEAHTKPFGGKCVILGGDFRQVLPVVKRGNKSQAIAASVRNSPLWCHTTCLQLCSNMRIRRKLKLCTPCSTLAAEG